MLPMLKQRTVVGWWTGTRSQWEEVLRDMKHRAGWRAPSYRLLSRNCNHFVQGEPAVGGLLF
jgi:hypothetical protein